MDRFERFTLVVAASSRRRSAVRQFLTFVRKVRLLSGTEQYFVESSLAALSFAQFKKLRLDSRVTTRKASSFITRSFRISRPRAQRPFTLGCKGNSLLRFILPREYVNKYAVDELHVSNSSFLDFQDFCGLYHPSARVTSLPSLANHLFVVGVKHAPFCLWRNDCLLEPLLYESAVAARLRRHSIALATPRRSRTKALHTTSSWLCRGANL